MKKLPKILVLDDDQDWLDQVPLIFEDECEVEGYPTIDQGLSAMSADYYDIILLDFNFSGDPRTGLDVFRNIHAMDRGVDVIVISAETDLQRLIGIMNAGVAKFISKPAAPAQVREAVRQTLELREIRLRTVKALAERDSRSGSPLVGRSAAMQRLREDIARVTSTGSKDILILGETGTGKELVARQIAFQTDRSARFIAIHCGAINDSLSESELFGHVKGAFTGADRERPGAFEAAGGGFVFLDEIGEMPSNQQVKLLRVIQERKVTRVGANEERPATFRTISATHVDLEKAIAEKRFRADLFYRVSGEKIVIPPLREHQEDIPELVQTFLVNAPVGSRSTITNEAMALLASYSWPGNVRQLGATVVSLAGRCHHAGERVIREKDVCQLLPDVAATQSSRFSKALVGSYGAQLLTGERKRFEKALIATNWDRTRAAEQLNMSRATFFRKAKELGLTRPRHPEDRDSDQSILA